MKKFALLIAFALLTLPLLSHADTITTYTFTESQCCGVPAGTVVLDDNGTSTVITATLNSGYGFFIDTGVHNLLTFNLTDPNLMASDVAIAPPAATAFTFLTYGSYANPPFGNFTYGIQCNNCKPSGKGMVIDSFSLTIADSFLAGGFLPNVYNGTSGPENIYFAADVSYNDGAKTGVVGATYTSTVKTPEPASLLLLGSGLVGLGLLRRRK